jgi:glycosyltransferase involved in cell wall biosynthesis
VRVLQLGPLYNNHLRRWSTHARALGHTVVAAGHVRPGRLPVDLSGLADEVAYSPEEIYGGSESEHLAWLSSVLERLRPDFVHAHWLPKWPYYAALLGQSPLLVTGWGCDVYVPDSETERVRGDLVLRRADRLIARSRHMRQAMVARGAPRERVDLADLGVDLSRFRPPRAGERARLRRELGLPEGPLVLSFRAGSELYNLDVVLEAFAIVRRRLPGATLVLVHGDAPLAPGAADALAGARGVRAVGRVSHSEMPAWFGAASVGVSIPRSDGSPSSVWEALASGLPLVLSDLPQIEEKLAGSGGALLVPPRAEAVADAIVRALAAAEPMGSAARRWALARCDEREQTERLAEVYAATSLRPAPAPAPAPVPAPAPAGVRAPRAAAGMPTAVALPRRPS